MAKERKRQTKVSGYVWCDVHGEIHDESNDPYDDGMKCENSDQRPVYVRAYPSEGYF